MSGGAAQQGRASCLFRVASMDVRVIEFEGTIQIGFYRDGWVDGAQRVMANEFVDTATPDQLIALARYLRRLSLPEPVSSAGDRP